MKLPSWVPRLPVGRWLSAAAKPVGKMIARTAVREGLDILQDGLKRDAVKMGRSAFSRNFDVYQARSRAAVARLPLLSAEVKVRLGTAVQEEGDALQKRIEEAFDAGGPAAFDALFDQAQEALLARIREL